MWYGEVTVTQEMLAAKYGSIFPHLDERQRRLLLGAEAARWVMAGSGWWPGPRASGRPRCPLALMSWSPGGAAGRARRQGGGRKPLADTDPGLVPALLALVEADERAIR